MKRLHQTILIISTVLGSWLGMQATHELGHVLGAQLTGGRVAKVVLNPLTISRTDLAHNPHPLVVVWAGPLLGTLLPLILWYVSAWVHLPGNYVVRFFAGFCLVANGAYLAIGSLDRIGDCGEMLRHGTPIWLLWLFGLSTIPFGLWLWHRQGPHFGLGHAQGTVHRGVAYVTLLVCAGLIVLGFAVDGE